VKLSGISCAGKHERSDEVPIKRRKAVDISDALLDQLLAGADARTADPDGLLNDLKKALAERALKPEMDHHLAAQTASDSRRGEGRKTVTTEIRQIDILSLTRTRTGGHRDT
jgi:putative transposase